ncbi:MAG TPA: homoserine O-succinyltransferase [Xanthomonadales bacterium]|nr:homoserine O-succinyltransferase [Xanthomonadales bacterium]
MSPQVAVPLRPAPVAQRNPLRAIPAPSIAERGEIALELPMRHSGTRRVALRYEIAGAADAPLLLVAGGISAGRHVRANACDASAGWWESQSGEQGLLHPGRSRVIAFDWLGADGALDCVVDPADQADAFALALDALGIARVHAFVGASYGAMVALQYAARHPGRVAQVVAIGGAHRAHPWSSALRALQRRAVVLGALQCDERQGLALARQLAMLTYRTPAELDARFAAPRVAGGHVRAGAEDWLDRCAETWIARATPTGFVRLSESIDLQCVDPAQIRVPLTVVAVREDLLVPLADLRALARGARGPAELHVIDSPYGHDAFLKEPAAIAAVLASALEGATP